METQLKFRSQRSVSHTTHYLNLLMFTVFLQRAGIKKDAERASTVLSCSVYFFYLKVDFDKP